MKFSLLASGSKGNCCVVTCGNDNIIIDCGSTKRYLTQCFDTLQYDYKKTNALLVTHAHSDHISQLKMFQDMPTYASCDLTSNHFTKVSAFQEFQINDIKITVLPMSHDSPNTVGYVLTWHDKKMVYVTDTGYIKEEVKEYIHNADYYIFESNHDIEMLMQTTRPIYLKQRIINDNGHLCNDDASNILAQVMGNKTKEIVLAHISQEGNTRELAYDTLKSTLQRKRLDTPELKLHAAGQFSIYSGGEDE